uniref:Secreted protein n=1 Tax=Trichogramma kaykai TaxID=54128 RepID=A0ABD2VZ72_9HYME
MSFKFLLHCVCLTAHTTRMSNFFMYRIVMFVETSLARVILSACFTSVSGTIMHRIDVSIDTTLLCK